MWQLQDVLPLGLLVRVPRLPGIGATLAAVGAARVHEDHLGAGEREGGGGTSETVSEMKLVRTFKKSLSVS